MKFITLSLLLVGCSLHKKMNDNLCSDALLKTVQFNSLIEYGVKDSSVYNIIDLELFYKTSDSTDAKNKWDSFINDTRFYEGQKTTLRTDYKDYQCECTKTRKSVTIQLTHKGISVSNIELIRTDSTLKIVEIKTAIR
jgi:hypothetical protein